MRAEKRQEFWNSLLTEKSWKLLQELQQAYEFILIGGWAVWLFTRQQKSKDIDIVVGIKELERLKELDLRKNEALKKYEVKTEEIDVDIYVEYYSKLAIPVEDIKKHTIEAEGFRVARPELLLVLKQAAYRDRKHSMKGEKDILDLMALVFFAPVDVKRYREILKAHRLEEYGQELMKLVRGFRDFDAFLLTPAQLKRKRKEAIEKLRRA